MSNYKEQLQNNNNELSAILETIEGLPEGGSGNITTGDWIPIASLPTTYAAPGGGGTTSGGTYYLELDLEVSYILLVAPAVEFGYSTNGCMSTASIYWQYNVLSGTSTLTVQGGLCSASIVSSDENSQIISLTFTEDASKVCVLPIFTAPRIGT